ncbi:hypothetical protein GALMADRAFT_244413 [Galerina marginata CBS 339.88]|uniref:J domain-containing protein n=1 Tax=Galerina marginata (strain CBS 339.88) TaxID=685588 RepID=A0A067T6K1_GALM3|nr:hypothetical protein GALMADRAFT_244413 [Galerina marginata CBS 339.88]
MSVQDALRILDISEAASPDEIKNAYRIMALKWHPDRHHNGHDKEMSTRFFLEVTNAYRTLVREGFVKPLNPVMVKHRPEPIWRAPPLAGQTSTESSISLDSFVHMVASSTESHTTPASSNRESPRSSWKQGIRQPAETLASQYRNMPINPRIFNYEAPPKGSGTGPALYRPPTPFAPTPRNLESIRGQPAKTKNKTAKTQDINSQFDPRQTSIPTSSTSHPAWKAAPGFQQAPPPPFPERANSRTHMPPYTIPLNSIGLGPSGEWVYSLSVSLEELFTGKHFRFGISRSYISGKTKNVIIEIDIPPGCRPGTRILCRNVGHEWKPGVCQDIAFIIEEAPHDRFIRLFDDLIMDVRLPWVDSLRRQGGKVPFMGIDGRSLIIQIDYPRDKTMKGRSIVKGGGMPVREHGQVVGRGNLIIQWEILPQKTKILHFMRRLWGGK